MNDAHQEEIKECTTGSMDDLWAFLHRMDKKIDLHIEESKRKDPKLDALIESFEQSKGVVKFIKLCAVLGTPMGALLLWAKDHVKW